jgi:hypothetical protein
VSSNRWGDGGRKKGEENNLNEAGRRVIVQRQLLFTTNDN